jgi:selT/selW/selH-like putative selenoprotein
VSLAEDLLKNYEHVIEEIKLVPSDEGRFEVIVNEQLIYSKFALHRHAEPGEVLGLIRKMVGE